MKKNIRIIIDILMFIIFIILMGYHITGNKIHEILGIIDFMLFIIHHILNIRWYKNIFKGKYNMQRIVSLIIDFLLLFSMIGMMISAMIISSTVFSFLNIKTTTFGRNLHLASTAWGFVLMSIHLGLHLNTLLYKIRKRIKNSSFEYTIYLLLILVFVYGIYSFIKTRLWEDMFLITKFKFFDYSQNKILFYLQYLAITIFISYTTYFILKNIKRRKPDEK